MTHPAQERPRAPKGEGTITRPFDCMRSWSSGRTEEQRVMIWPYLTYMNILQTKACNTPLTFCGGGVFRCSSQIARMWLSRILVQLCSQLTPQNSGWQPILKQAPISPCFSCLLVPIVPLHRTRCIALHFAQPHSGSSLTRLVASMSASIEAPQ